MKIIIFVILFSFLLTYNYTVSREEIINLRDKNLFIPEQQNCTLQTIIPTDSLGWIEEMVKYTWKYEFMRRNCFTVQEASAKRTCLVDNYYYQTINVEQRKCQLCYGIIEEIKKPTSIHWCTDFIQDIFTRFDKTKEMYSLYLTLSFLKDGVCAKFDMNNAKNLQETTQEFCKGYCTPECPTI